MRRHAAFLPVAQGGTFKLRREAGARSNRSQNHKRARQLCRESSRTCAHTQLSAPEAASSAKLRPCDTLPSNPDANLDAPHADCLFVRELETHIFAPLRTSLYTNCDSRTGANAGRGGASGSATRHTPRLQLDLKLRAELC